MAKRMMTTLGLIGLLTIGQIVAMQNTNPDTVARIAGLIQTFGFEENTPETKEIILDALQDVMANDEEISQAFQKVQSQEKEIAQEEKTSEELGRELTVTEKVNAQKMMMINEAIKRHEDSLKKVGDEVKDISKGIGGKLHEVSANPVLDGKLKFEGAPTPFKIRDLLKEDGSIDLSDPVFGDASKYLLITTDPEKFFNIVENSKRLVVLIAPRFLIEEISKTSKKHFNRINNFWKSNQPYAIFWRPENWDNLEIYDMCTHNSQGELSAKYDSRSWNDSISWLDQISKFDKYKIYKHGWHPDSEGRAHSQYYSPYTEALLKFSFIIE